MIQFFFGHADEPRNLIEINTLRKLICTKKPSSKQKGNTLGSNKDEDKISCKFIPLYERCIHLTGPCMMASDILIVTS